MSCQVTAAIMDVNFLSRDGIRLLIEEEGFDVAIAVSTYAELVEAIRERGDDLLIFLSDDYLTPMMEAAITAIRKDKVRSKIILLLRDFDDENRHRLERLGVEGLLLKSTSRHVLMRSIELVMLGEHVFSVSHASAPETRRRIVEPPEPVIRAAPEENSLRAAANGEQPAEGDHPPEAEPAPTDPAEPIRRVSRTDPVSRRDTLSAREEEILLCLVEGLSNKVIARRCDITEATVKVHLKAILRKIKALNRTQAAVWMMGQMRQSPIMRVEGDEPPHADISDPVFRRGVGSAPFLHTLAAGLHAPPAISSPLPALRP